MIFMQFSMTPAVACFGPKLFIGTEPGLAGEMRFHLVALYLHEKTGIESQRVEFVPGETALAAIAAEKIDLGFSLPDDAAPEPRLTLETGRVLYSGKRPLEDLQFSTVPRALAKLQQRLAGEDLSGIEQEIAAGVLPAAAVRHFMLREGWI